MSDNFSGKYQEKKKQPLRPFLSVIGLIILGLGIAGAYFGSEPVASWLLQQDFLAGAALDLQTLRILVGIVTVLITISIFAAAFAVFQPKTSKLVDEQTLKKEKEQKEAEERRKKKRRQAMLAKMRDANKDLSEL